MTYAARPPARAPQVTSAEVASRLMTDIDAAMDDLLALLEEETRLVRAGRLKDAAALAASKEEKATHYTRLMLVARDEVTTLASHDPTGLEALKRRHELFRAEVQINLAVLATARTVAEDLIRQVAADVAPTPAAYGRPGTPQPAAKAGVRGLVGDRTL